LKNSKKTAFDIDCLLLGLKKNAISPPLKTAVYNVHTLRWVHVNKIREETELNKSLLLNDRSKA